MTKQKHRRIHELTLKQFEQVFLDEDACRDYMIANRWPDGPRCDYLDAREVSDYKWVCSHKISAKYLLLYVAEFQSRYKNRKNSEIFDMPSWGF